MREFSAEQAEARDAWIARNEAMTLDRAVEVLKGRAKELDLHMSRFPWTLDRSMEETSAAINLVLASIQAGRG